MTILMTIYYLGILSCGFQGAKKAMKKHLNKPKLLLCSYLTSFGGGLFRDICILHTHPAVFTIGCLPDVLIALSSAWLYMRFLHHKRYIEIITILADSIGLAQFITIGVDRALSLEKNYAIAILSGVCTSLGGGIVSSLFIRESLKKTIFSNALYRIIDITGTILYVVLLKNDNEHITAQSIIVTYTLFLITISNSIITQALKKHIQKSIFILHGNITEVNYEYLHFIITSKIYGEQLFCRLSAVTNIFRTSTKQPFCNRKRTFLYHRLRQM